jgi:hypothetical protein
MLAAYPVKLARLEDLAVQGMKGNVVAPRIAQV